ncbi:unnamed protein product [Effrenium voratum]|nr:unnamed protein product [Effrenium voratum]
MLVAAQRAVRRAPLRGAGGLVRWKASQAEKDAEDMGNCPVFAKTSTARPDASAEPGPALRFFRRVPPDVVRSIHAGYWLLVGGPVPRHLQEQGIGWHLSLDRANLWEYGEVIAVRLLARMAMLGIGATLLWKSSSQFARSRAGWDKTPKEPGRSASACQGLSIDWSVRCELAKAFRSEA